MSELDFEAVTKGFAEGHEILVLGPRQGGFAGDVGIRNEVV